MRDVEFRVWKKWKKKMFEVQMIELLSKGHVVLPYGDKKWIYGNQTILMQWIGAVDKDGKNIFENDIIEEIDKIDNKKFRLLIKWNSFKCEFVGIAFEQKGDNELIIDVTYLQKFKVIGNKNENPELLNKKNA